MSERAPGEGFGEAPAATESAAGPPATEAATTDSEATEAAPSAATVPSAMETPSPALAGSGADAPSAEAASDAGTHSSDAADAGTPAADASAAVPPARRRGLVRLRGLLRLPRTRRGMLAMLLVFGALGAASVFGAASVVAWTETADFCGRCHQMGPELAAYQAGPHADVACAECHVEPGVGGWIKAKINGTKQLIQVITGLYPKPVPPPDHDMLPSYKDTCLRCHSLQQLATTGVRTKTQFTED